VAISDSSIDNTENLWVPVTAGRTYRLQVSRGADQEECQWDFALAWRMTMPPDSDGDGIPDDWEVQFGLEYQNADDGSEDSDGDGLDNLAEYLAGTDIGLSDTDGDGVSDGTEVDNGSDPLDAESMPESEAVPAMGAMPLALMFGLLLWVGINKKITKS
jgi:hypothetical protein